MPPTPTQIREQLLRAIDQDAKVINMVCVLEAISCLENTQITKEALEETRLGKIVNDIRKNTDDSSLSTRCKKLVRVWSKQFVRGTPGTGKPAGPSPQEAAANRQPTPPTQGAAAAVPSAAGGSGRTPSLKSQTSTTTTTPTPTLSVDKRKSENRKRRKQSDSQSPSVPAGSEPTAPKRPRPAAACTPTSNATKDGADPETKNGMPGGQRVAGKSNLQSTKSAFAKVKPSAAAVPPRTSSPALKARESSSSSSSSPSLRKLNASPSEALSKSPRAKHSPSPVNSKGSRLSPAVKASKLSPSAKTRPPRETNSTESSRLKADASVGAGKGEAKAEAEDKAVPRQPRGKSPSLPKKTLEDSNSSAATVKLRPPPSRERSATPSITVTSDAGDASAQDSVRPAGLFPEAPPASSPQEEKSASKMSFSIFDDDYGDDDNEQEEIHCDEKYSRILGDFERDSPRLGLSATGTLDADKSTAEGSLFDDARIVTDGPGGKDAALKEDAGQEAIAAGLEEEEEEEAPPSHPVTEEDIAKVQREQWDGVNGCYDSQKQWCDWTQTLSISLEDDHALHILPYVCLD